MSDDIPSYISPSGLAGLPEWASAAGLMIEHSRDGGLQCGIDIIEVERVQVAIERWGQRFLNRVWTEHEQRICRGRFPELAARFAGKEAVSKALGTGIVGLVWREIEILQDRRGKPLVFLHGAAHERADALGFSNLAISLSHTKALACAMVVASGRN
jgi:holo-[acyl-carrier protein] synthase